MRIGKYRMMQERSRLRWRRVIILGSARGLLRYEDVSTKEEVVPFLGDKDDGYLDRYWPIWIHRRGFSGSWF